MASSPPPPPPPPLPGFWRKNDNGNYIMREAKLFLIQFGHPFNLAWPGAWQYSLFSTNLLYPGREMKIKLRELEDCCTQSMQLFQLPRKQLHNIVCTLIPPPPPPPPPFFFCIVRSFFLGHRSHLNQLIIIPLLLQLQ